MVDEVGLMFLASRGEQTSAIVRTLMGARAETETEEAEVSRKVSTDDAEGKYTNESLSEHFKGHLREHLMRATKGA